MKQQEFETANEEVWRRLEALVEVKQNKDIDPQQKTAALSDLPAQYRRVCHQLALAKHRRYSPSLVDRLNRLVVNCHNLVYSQSTRFRYQWLKFFLMEFPAVLHRNRRYIWISTFLFLAPAVVIGIMCYLDPEMIYTVMDWSQVRGMENMYDPSNRILGRERESATDLYMFGFYIYNNIGIAFRTFAGGVFFGIGSFFIIVFNGIVLGAVTGHLTQLGYYSTFYPFVIGHGSFELTALVLSGAAGLKLGGVLINPGPLKRGAALKNAARDVVQIILGAAAMLLIAAFIEAFWSSKASLPIPVKLSVGAVLWALVLGYLCFVGRRYRHDFK